MQNTSVIDQAILSERLLTVKQASEYIKWSRAFLWQLRKQGKLSSVNAGKKILISKAELDTFLQKEVAHG
jgi:excisionase family DNA binding protein